MTRCTRSRPIGWPIVEGVEGPVPGQQLDRHWWGGNLEGVRSAPVRLARDHKLVYSPHEYGPGVHAQPWFSQPNFQEILYDRWQKGFDYIADDDTAPILVGEFGGKQTGTDTVEGIWQRQLIDFIGRRGHSWTYWSWNPNSGDTGGVLGDDWRTPVAGKLALLQQLQRREPIDFPGATPWGPGDDVGGGTGGGGGSGSGSGGSGTGSGGAGGPSGAGGQGDGDAPDTRITSEPDERGPKRRVRFRFESDSGDRFECRIDERDWQDCESPARYRLSRGRHVFRVRAWADDVADPSPARSSFRIASR